MTATFFIPKKINVGFQERGGTFTGKLAYVIYFDEKGKLRKEASWNSWRDKKIDNEICDNEPTSGFVLNKKVGDYVSDWNHRQAYVRVYDPRGFEFEITIQNLLYILENATSTKGKGLEGDFVYGWDGKDLVLIPCEAPDYKKLVEYNNKLHNQVKLKGKDLKVGGTYLHKDNKQLVYLGRFDEWTYEYIYENVVDSYGRSMKKWTDRKLWKVKRKSYFFANASSGNIVTIQSLSKDIIDTVSEECADNYAELMDKLECDTLYSPIDDSKDEYVDFSLDEFLEAFGGKTWGISFYDSNKKLIEIRKEYSGNRYYFEYRIEYQRESKPIYSWQKPSTYTDWKYEKEWFDTLEDVFNKYQPSHKRKYLANGKIYSEGY